jgi:hypothetical protein
MKAPSPLGAAVEAAVDRDIRFRRHREPVQYLCCYQTAEGRVFAFERVTKTQINLWLPESAAVRSAAEKEGLLVRKSVPFPDPTKPTRYGRISSLKPITELCDASLYRIVVISAGQAIAVLGALA